MLTLKEFKRNYVPATELSIYVMIGERVIDRFVADYTCKPSDESDNIGLMLDLYALDATVKHVCVNPVDHMLEIWVQVDPKQPLFEYSIWGVKGVTT